MAKLNPYLNFDGTCEEAFRFYKVVFGGEFLGDVHKMKDIPGMEIPEEAKNRIMHVALPVGNDLLMGSDVFPGQPFVQGNNNYISLFPESREEADRLFGALSEGGEVEMPMADQFWGDYFGSLKDKFGVYWMINYNSANQ
ncbi:MAG: VOC family protein [Petrimonas sp.]|jgi:PhnB protein|uniref:VOC family protein n=1 Tax=Petrimonas TaxID=307628 RepID=UPI000E9D153A|nr:VOC family protein [Petrimonas sp.]NLU29925.1 VOC family protein [Bacteroidales bacterium]BBD46347.1 PhnB protein; DNA binding 3-demethylubiquinone-93-methyltransferase domain protein [Petrimonas sp. IBARAKI]HAC73244.1 VOC family protein [Porphyromonadaceae bacterium]MDD3541551.1 VOC family protein [Petrimonas sp.]